jgi:molybdopterin converting factor small subunit
VFLKILPHACGTSVAPCRAGGVIEDVPRGTTAGEILREKGVLAILEDDESSSTDSDAEPTDLAARSSSSSSSRQQQVQQRSSGSAAPGPPEKLQALAPGGEAGIEASSMQQQQVRLVNVNNRLVSEDTVLSDGDLVILARERIKI